jgi:hypothetical protein
MEATRASKLGTIFSLSLVMNPSDIPLWGWLLLAAFCALFQFLIGEFTAEDSLRGWAIRLIIIAGAVVATLIALIRFIKWVWQG